MSRTQGTVTTDYAYDAANHLTQVREGGSVVAGYEYDAAGQRTKKSVDGETVNYYYDGIDLLYTEDGNGQTIDTNILEEDGSLIATMQGGDMWWYRQDIRGSITNVVDSDGNLGKSYIYSAYWNTQSDGMFSGSFAYTGALLDEETGLTYMNARYYDSETGRLSIPAWIVSAAIDGIILFIAGAVHAAWMGIMAPVKYLARKAALRIFTKSIIPAVRRIANTVVRVAVTALARIGRSALAASINVGVSRTLGTLTSNGGRFLSACMSLGGLIAAFVDIKTDGRFDGWIKLW